mgnify:CR=1 FL=1
MSKDNDDDKIISFPQGSLSGELGSGLAHLRDQAGLPPGAGEENKVPVLSVKLPIQTLISRVTELLKAPDGRHGLFRRGDDIGTIDPETGLFTVMTPKWFRTWLPKNRGVFLQDGVIKSKDDNDEVQLIPREGELTKDQCETLLIRGGELWVKLPVIRDVHPVKLPVLVHEEDMNEKPVLDERGNVPIRLLKQGYDPRTGIWTHKGALDFDEDMDFDEAVNTLYKPFCTFGWRNELRDMAIHFAAIMSTFCRGLYDGPTPMFVYNANQRKSGKSVLAAVPGWLVTGSKAIMALLPDAEEALEKRLAAVANSNKPFLNFDNVDWKGKKIESGKLDGWLTGTEAEFQKFFTQDMVSKIYKTVTIMSGNKLELSEDLDRRSLMADLLNHLPVAETKPPKGAIVLDETWFRATENRKQMLSACWAIVREWDKAGRPKGPMGELGSFEPWSQIIPHLVYFAGNTAASKPWNCMMVSANTEIGDKDTRDFAHVCEMALVEFGRDDDGQMQSQFEVTVAQLAGVARRHAKCGKFLYPISTIEDVLATENQRGGWSFREHEQMVLDSEKDQARQRQASEFLEAKTRSKFGLALKDRIHEKWFRGPDGQWYQFDHVSERTPAAYYVERSKKPH